MAEIKVGDIVRIYKVGRNGSRINFEEKDIVTYVDEVHKTVFKAGGVTFLKRNSRERNPNSYYTRKAELADETALDNYKDLKEKKALKNKIIRELKDFHWANLTLDELINIKKQIRGI